MSIGTIEAPPGPAGDDGISREWDIENVVEDIWRYLDTPVSLPGVSKTEVGQPHFRRNTRTDGAFRLHLPNGLGHMALGGPWQDKNELMW